MYKFPNGLLFFDKRNKGQLFIALPQLLLVLLVISLLVYTVAACIKFTKRSTNTIALERKLLLLQARFIKPASMNPETERQEMEVLHNSVKTSSDAAQISRNTELKQLFQSNCLSLQNIMNNADLENRTGWIKLNQVMLDFNQTYFQ